MDDRKHPCGCEAGGQLRSTVAGFGPAKCDRFLENVFERYLCYRKRNLLIVLRIVPTIFDVRAIWRTADPPVKITCYSKTVPSSATHISYQQLPPHHQ